MIDGDAGEECGVVGIWTPGVDVAELLTDGLFALQHRGQESAGISVGDKNGIVTRLGMGLVAEVLRAEVTSGLRGHVGIGHVRYSTSAGSSLDNAQPFHERDSWRPDFALAHNGNLTELPVPARVGAAGDGGARSDTRRLASLLGPEPGTLGDAMAAVLPRTRGAFSLVGVSSGALLAARDPHGFRPLSLGRLPDGGWAVASETAALDGLGATGQRDVEPGELVEIDEHGVHTRQFAAAKPALCVFEHVYFARPDSVIGGRSVFSVRDALGAALARHEPADADVVIPVPDTARVAALGYARESGIPYGEGLFRSTYANRSFIQPSPGERRRAVRLKLRPIAPAVAGRRVVVVDDSIVRATSMRHVVALLREAGAAEVHVRVASPPVRWPCFFGVDIGSARELVAVRLEPAEIAELVGADSLGYLPAAAMVAAASGSTGFCTACFTGDYPAR
ncbi:amidophosphoribosyltransferase [Actinophytocola sp.]|uniref:amidophosphoribosyltransferase n=1 Tax=Actinophytocola sp. TaxID=1872138 RepID=UPI00389AF347